MENEKENIHIASLYFFEHVRTQSDNILCKTAWLTGLKYLQTWWLSLIGQPLGLNTSDNDNDNDGNNNKSLWLWNSRLASGGKCNLKFTIPQIKVILLNKNIPNNSMKEVETSYEGLFPSSLRMQGQVPGRCNQVITNKTLNWIEFRQWRYCDSFRRRWMGRFIWK